MSGETLRLDRASGRREVARGGQPERPIAGAQRNDGLHRTLADERVPMTVARPQWSLNDLRKPESNPGLLAGTRPNLTTRP
jgi:hypothetical protein